MIVSEQLEQGSEQWLAIRKGRATASEFSKILTPTGQLSAQRIKYMRKLARECVAEDPLEWMGNKYTDWGNNTEPEARDYFTERTGIEVDEVGFCSRGDGAPLGCSPDGLIRDSRTGEWVAGLELKCPQVDTHVNYLMEGELPNEYRLQVHGSMAVTGLNVWWFMSYFPGLEPLILKVERDSFTEKVSKELDKFLIEYASERELVLAAILPKEEEATPLPFNEDLSILEQEESLI